MYIRRNSNISKIITQFHNGPILVHILEGKSQGFLSVEGVMSNIIAGPTEIWAKVFI